MRWSSHCDSSIIAFWFHGKHLQQQRLHHPKLRCAFKMQKSWKIYETIWKNHENSRKTLLKTNIAPENKPSQKERIIFQPSMFIGELLVLGRVNICMDSFAMVGKNWSKQGPTQLKRNHHLRSVQNKKKTLADIPWNADQIIGILIIKGQLGVPLTVYPWYL